MGMDLELLNSCKYRLIRQFKDDKIKWFCMNKNRYVKTHILTTKERSIILKVYGQHKP